MTGVGNIIAGMVNFLEEDFKKWQSFDKIPRVASHTPFGVIELMPTSDNITYSFKYVNGHPSNPARGYQTVTASVCWLMWITDTQSSSRR